MREVVLVGPMLMKREDGELHIEALSIGDVSGLVRVVLSCDMEEQVLGALAALGDRRHGRLESGN